MVFMSTQCDYAMIIIIIAAQKQIIIIVVPENSIFIH